MAHGGAKKTIRQLRQERGWSQAKLATRLGMVPRTVSTWERGVRTPDPRTLVRLAELFSISPTDIALARGRQ